MKEAPEIELSAKELQLVSSEVAVHFGVLPKGISGEVLELYIKQEEASSAHKDELELILARAVHFHPVSAAAIDKGISKYYRTQNSNQQKTSFNLKGDFLENLIWDAKSTGSSDIHFEIFKDLARIRFRIDGKLIERYQINIEEYPELVNKIKIKSNLNITEKRLPQDGRINYDAFDIRVSILPTLHGEKIVMRILGKDTSNISIEALGMTPFQQELYRKAITATKGIILISGPTGSGKTTTLYATLKILNKPSTNILTIEDPIEYTLKGINQVQLKDDIGLTFSSALKTFLRQDPDIIMLGEIRDEQTAQMAIRASLTGHLVLSTIHTNSALGTLSRLIDMGVPTFLIAETLRVSIAQRLVRKLCSKCKRKEPFVPTEFPIPLTGITHHYIPVGCSSCHYTGYDGRIAIYEFISMTPEIKKAVKENKIYENSKLFNHERLSHKATQLVKEGMTSVLEAIPIIIEDVDHA